MALADYSHHNEDARHIWWQEEGRFEGGSDFDLDRLDFDGPDDYDEDDF